MNAYKRSAGARMWIAVTMLAAVQGLDVAAAGAVETYVSGAVYTGDAQVCFGGDLYRAKWWAGPEDHPADVDTVGAPWETPWERLQADAPVCSGGEPVDLPPVAVASAAEERIVGAGTVQLSALGSSDPEGAALTFQWQQIAPQSPVVALAGASTATPLATFGEPASATTYVFEVVVGDGTSTARAQVTVDQLVEVDSVDCPAWDGSAVYVADDVVAHDGAVWVAYWWTTGEEPGTTGMWGVWRAADASACSGETPDPNDPSDPNEPDPNEPDPNSPDPNEPSSATVIPLSVLLAEEDALTSGDLMALVKESIATRDNAVVEAVAPGAAGNPENVQRVESIVDESTWEYLFPRRAPEYTYTNFLKAIAKFPAFCGAYEDGRDADAICRRALATMFAHFTQETGGHTIAWPEPQWRQGLVYLRELGWSESMPNGYGLCDPSTWQGATWACGIFPDGSANAGQFKSYFGRGAKQLSYNYNYGPFSAAMFGDTRVLLDQPELVADTWLNLASAVFFYVYPQPPKPSMLHALDGTWVPNQHDLDNGLTPGFGVTTQIINGGIECGGSQEHAQSLNRIDYYTHFAADLDVPVEPDEVLGCAGMQRFDTAGAGALSIYWEQDWSRPNACKLVNYQTQFSALTPGDYVDCVRHYFDVAVDYDN